MAVRMKIAPASEASHAGSNGMTSDIDIGESTSTMGVGNSVSYVIVDVDDFVARDNVAHPRDAGAATHVPRECGTSLD